MEPGFQAFLLEQLRIAKMSLSVMEPTRSLMWNMIVNRWSRLTPAQKKIYVDKTRLVE